MNFITPLSLITLSDEQSTNFLQGYCTGDLSSLEDRHAIFTACCDLKGRVVANFWCWKVKQTYYIALASGMEATLLNHLKPYAIFSRVAMAPMRATIRLSDTQTSTDNIVLPNQCFLAVDIHDSEEPTNHEIDPSITDPNWAEHNHEHGLAWMTNKTSALFTPQMLDMGRYQGLSFNKGCYLGQEIIARTEHLGTLKRHLYRLTLDNTVAAGDPLLNSQNEKRGTIVTAYLHNDQGKTDGKTDCLAVIEDRALSDWPTATRAWITQ